MFSVHCVYIGSRYSVIQKTFTPKTLFITTKTSRMSIFLHQNGDFYQL